LKFHHSPKLNFSAGQVMGKEEEDFLVKNDKFGLKEI
jgi:hypothetical protein